MEQLVPERRHHRVDGRTNPASRHDDQKIEKVSFTYEVEGEAHKIIRLVRQVRLELLRLEDGGPDAA